MRNGHVSTAPEDRQSVRDLLRGRSLVVVSNREPYIHDRSVRGIEVQRPAGGLVAALDPVLREVGGVWVAWGSGEADFEVVNTVGEIHVPPEDPRYLLKRVRLSSVEVERFYHGFSNQSLWPLFHMAVDKARFVRRYWAAYQAVNRRFAEATLETLDRDAVVWIQDYHLALCPLYLRERRPDLLLMHFWHIPWPAWDVLRICPQSAELVEGLLANDLLGFHLSRHVENFLECAERELGADVDRTQGVVTYQGHRTLVQAFPISIDVAAWDRLAATRACARWMARLRHRFRLDGRLVGVGVDRLDYTKGILERLRAIELLFQRSPQFRERFVYIQKAAPSRTRIKAYRDLQKRIEAEIMRLNATYGTAAWQPVIYIPRPLPAAGMAALYRMADVCLVTSLLDGMNLVAKEYVACQRDEHGVLILSELAGAAEAAAWSTTVNPYDPEAIADALAAALTAPADERRGRMAQLRGNLARRDIQHWMEQHFRAAGRLLDGRVQTRRLFDDLQAFRRTVLARDRLALLLDFDGTLAPIVDHPDAARLDPAMRASLARLASHPRCLVAVITGRALSDIQQRVGLDGIYYAGNHGLVLAGPGWSLVHDGAADAWGVLAQCSQRLSARLAHIEGVIVENKGLSATVHYRLVPRTHHAHVIAAVLDELGRVPPGRLEVLHGKMALELRPAIDWNKGTAARWLLDRALGPRWPVAASVIYAGDDVTDEDAFTALGEGGVTIRVGSEPEQTIAHYVLRDVAEVGRLLDTLGSWLDAHALVGLASALP
jgi:alpha,alpha-trehalose-phosphate synthase [UDP-forming]/trehalose-phosphatase